MKMTLIELNLQYSIATLSGAVHTGVKVHEMVSEMCGLMEQPWLQLMCYTICLPCDHNFR